MADKVARTVTSWSTDAELAAALYPVLINRSSSRLRDELFAVLVAHSVEVADV